MKPMKKLNKIAEANLCGIVNAYRDEHRAWMDQVDENRIESELRDPDFEAFVRLIEAIASPESNFPSAA